MAENIGLENEADSQGRRSEQVARSEAECQTSPDKHDAPIFIMRVPRSGVVYPPKPKVKPVFNVTKITCKKCGCIVLINIDTQETILNKHIYERYDKKYGLCRSCFVNLKDRKLLR